MRRREAERMRVEAEPTSNDAVEIESSTKFDIIKEVDTNLEVSSDGTESEASEAKSE